MIKNNPESDDLESPFSNKRKVFEAAIECGVLDFMAGISSMTGSLSAAVIEYTDKQGQLIKVGYGKHGSIDKSSNREFVATGYGHDRVTDKPIADNQNRKKSYK
ncbi:hypothetical protein [Aliivibrio fischeri]|uniref:hypothetical protein n=1 Tax=Aliivibrio fischeri TaxID=668 RepID=UPI0012D8AD46|nr:hypothetical protein [Aliivibrio fischeri]MUJ20484.1 hypothetical protein [Aliivibrio fischeri]